MARSRIRVYRPPPVQPRPPRAPRPLSDCAVGNLIDDDEIVSLIVARRALIVNFRDSDMRDMHIARRHLYNAICGLDMLSRFFSAGAPRDEYRRDMAKEKFGKGAR